ncbi:hypothetical protein Ae201684P_014936 [Aphanomyces euteiches]|uniref:PHD-type domain-containing protein n=1 Tax=Aphanomyces euteiches TaxID=100861 RepID=A0A6G0XHC3_9STRA|nr:hypothetical protein Ae201684_004843 [Aphanomyces euteiches]KAH9073119.1 hypothetical protein Ae201684P_014936 [Aphanomyces euteiches]KAH9138333.1 hypothetical protein AeRB84_017351 [Aphanomyces euteiches]
MLKVGRSVVQMHYEVCEMCGKSRVVSLDNTIGLVPPTKSVRTTERVIRDTCTCKRRRGNQAPVKPSKPSTPSPPQSRRKQNANAAHTEDEQIDDESEQTTSRRPSYTPRSLRIRLKKVDDGYMAIPTISRPIKIQIHHYDGVFIAVPPPSRGKKRSASQGESESDASSTTSEPSTPSTSPAPSAPSSPVRIPVHLPNGLSMADLSIPPWTVMHTDAPNNRTQCEVCGKQGELICCDRCPSVFHTDCLPRDHVVNVNPWLCPSCLQTPFDQEKACRLCAGDTNLSQIILCDCCDDEYHLYCLNPPLLEVPEGDWFCPVCSSQGHTRRQCLKKKRGGQKQRPQFSYPSLLAETHEDLTILDRGAWMRPPVLGKQWSTEDVRKLTQAQSKARHHREKVTGRVRREDPSLVKFDSNVEWFQKMLPASAREKMVRLVYSTQLNAEFRIRLHMSDRVGAILQWRYAWASADLEVDVFMRLLRTWHELEQSLQQNRYSLPPPPSPPHLKWGFGRSTAPIQLVIDRPQSGYERMSLVFDRPERHKQSELDPLLIAKLAQLRISSPMSVRSILNPF